MRKRPKKRRSKCPVANALDILGDRWSLVIVRDLMFRGKREYGEMIDSEEGISTSVLASRLERLQCSGIIKKTEHPADRKKYIYHLTEKGIDLVPVLVDLTLWGIQHLPGTFAPADILKAMKKDRDGLIRGIKQRLRNQLAP